MADPRNPNDDPFESLLSLEQQYHAEGYNLGYADGSKAGRIEGRLFGLEKGFEKFAELGRLNGRAAIWQARLPNEGTEVSKVDSSGSAQQTKLAQLSGSDRLRKHIRRLGELTDLEEMSTENSEDAVQDVDERVKDARAKSTLVSRIVGENDDALAANAGSSGDGAGTARRGVRVKPDEAHVRAKSGEMEDFGGIGKKLQK